MRKQFSALALFLLGCFPFISAQTVETIRLPKTDKGSIFVNTKKLPVQSLKAPIALDPKAVVAQAKWNITLSQFGINHGGDSPKNLIDSIKQAGSLLMKNADALLKNGPPPEEAKLKTGLAISPVIQASFKGNNFDAWSPPDNNIAVSDDGYVVSVINSSIFFADETGAVLMESKLGDFLSALNLNGAYFDPKVLYDPEEDKFILVVLNGNTPATSRIVIAFSTSGNPNDKWWLYSFSGDPTNSGLWFDYPSIGISKDDLYISGNQFTENGTLSTQALIYQLDKAPGFKGEFVTGIQWVDVRDAYGVIDFTIVPLSYGFDGSVSPGIYLVSTDGSGGSEAMVYYTDNNAKNNPQLFVFSTPVAKYYTPFNGLMKGTTDEIRTNDTRALSGFYADGTIHFVFNTRGDDFHTKLYYCRIKTEDLSQSSVRIGLTPYEYAYPSVAPFATSPADKSVLIGFLRTSGSIYPEFRVVGVDQDMNITNSLLVKEGESFINFYTNNTKERWGDYSGISRRHSAAGAEVWVAGCYGANNDNGFVNVLGTWIAQITDGQTGTAPVANFTGSPTTLTAGQSVAFTDQSSNSPTSWTWSFPGGTPATAIVKNPVVTYNAPGTYSVTLVVGNNAGNDSETKTNYITVNAGAQAPVANFTGNPTTLTTGQSVAFTDQSSNSPISWTWSFPGGTPATATVKNPVVTYNTPGTYSVTLVAGNNTGNDPETKAGYITVNPLVQAPIADFTSDVVNVSPGGIVSFEDLSANIPSSWQWFFPGGLPNASTLQDPIIVYPEAGCFDVTLVATNAAGTHTVTKPCYIRVQTTDVEEQKEVFSRFTLFPNPVTDGSLNIVFEMGKPAELKFFVVDNRGAVVRELLHRRVKAGLNQLAFNTDPLAAGAYYLVVLDERNAVLKNQKFIK